MQLHVTMSPVTEPAPREAVPGVHRWYPGGVAHGGFSTVYNKDPEISWWHLLSITSASPL